MPSISPGRGVPTPALPVALALVLVFASVGAVAGGGPASGVDPAAVSTETHIETPTTEAPTATPASEPEGVNLTLLAGSGAVFEELDDYEAFRAASEVSALERTRRVRRGDTLAFAFRSPRLNRSYAAAEATGTTPRFFEAVNRSNATVSITSPAAPSCERLRIRLQESRARALVQSDGPEFAVVLDTDAVATEGGCDGELAVPGEYQVTVAVPTADGEQRSTAGFELLQRSRGATDDTRIRRGGPSVAPTLDSAAAIRQASRNRTLISSTRAVGREVVVLSFRSRRLHRTYVNTSGPNATARLSAAVEATGGELSLAVPRGSTDGGPVVLPGPGVRTIHDDGNARFHLVLDTGRMQIRRGNGTRPLTATTEQEVEFLLRVPRPDDNTQRFRAQVFLQEPSGQLRIARNRSLLPDRGSRVGVVGPDGRVVARPETNLAPGWNLTLRAERPDGTTVATRRGRSRAPGAAPEQSTYAFELGPLSPDDRFDLTLHAANETLDRAPVAVGARPTLRNATARRLRTGPDGTMVRFAVTAHYPGPGFVVVRNGSEFVGFPVPGDEPTRVRGTVRLPRRGDERPEVRLIAVYDSDHDGTFDGPGESDVVDRPFRLDDRGLLTAQVELPPPTPSPTVTAPPPGTTIPLSGTDGQPGFGPLAAVLGVLTLVGLTAGRRRLRDSG